MTKYLRSDPFSSGGNSDSFRVGWERTFGADVEDKIARFLQMDSKGRWIISFGKYEGSFLEDIVLEDKGYLEWFLNQNIPQRVHDIIDETLNGG